MSEVFVSYKREDQLAVARLVQALDAAGFPVWWDRYLPGGESWRAGIEQALAAARCVIVVWSRASVGPAGDFVRDEAGQGKRRGILVPVLLEAVAPPLGFGEMQAIDLSRWSGGARDADFLDLCAAVRAKLSGSTPPPASGPTRRLRRRLTYGSVVSAAGIAVLAAGVNLFGVQERLCAADWLQPRLSDLCGALGVGQRPTRDERLAWEGREPASCAALRNHLARFPDGFYRAPASALLAARRLTPGESWQATQRRLPLFVMPAGAPAASENAARAAALQRAQRDAQQHCQGFAASTLFRLTAAQAQARSWQCSRVSGGTRCGFDGEAVCDLQEKHPQESESCAAESR